jgi:hypothetical protein
MSNKNECSVKTNQNKGQNKCYYSPNKILIARTTYYSSENNKNINERKILKRKEYKHGNMKK